MGKSAFEPSYLDQVGAVTERIICNRFAFINNVFSSDYIFWQRLRVDIRRELIGEEHIIGSEIMP